jgi:hypothetical protein
LFVWANSISLPDGGVFTFARSDDFFFGVLHSRLHEVWALKQGTHLEDRPRYTPTTCFETFPFPFADDLSSAVRRDIFVETSAKVLPSAVGAAYSAPDGAKSNSTAGGYKDSAPDGAGQPRPSSSVKSAIANRQSAMDQSLVTSAPTKDEHRAAIAAAAKELNELRERWLNPPEWTVEKILEFPGSVDGPWSRYIEPSTINPQQSTGLVRYPRLEPRDADCAAKLKDRTLTKLYNERPAWLGLAHKKLDAAVATAYGWVRAGQATVDLTDEQILEKLLALNLERAAEEAEAEKVKKPKVSREKKAEEMI